MLAKEVKELRSNLQGMKKDLTLLHDSNGQSKTRHLSTFRGSTVKMYWQHPKKSGKRVLNPSSSDYFSQRRLRP